ncbi:mannose-6-phosphate isomerase, type 2 [Austwickia chelonae]|uniref:Putative mannose-6-phosphate isomerase n=1 Tax=Austwickia chelonae NBRC 105200 TaxID=1184607 RepID=K6UM56_9MICO|nr:phosphomannose isomerase type II C-terminal cupin domain [Austwickia chelonae]GAB77821.1 putative mannose-6-phosphate isomerase [Austwickia chelonae NBRC 105200]SEV90177.1 mannose-6-phosphate isomerase, type 2 [Austwickia chelonae]
MTNLDDRRADVFSVERPWGDFRSFCQNERATVKVITVNPGQRLSLQTHAQRAEMWTVLDAAPLEVTVGERTWSAEQGELIWVPQGAVHRMANTGDRPARILEVGFGHFDEEDIVRIEDDYARD